MSEGRAAEIDTTCAQCFAGGEEQLTVVNVHDQTVTVPHICPKNSSSVAREIEKKLAEHDPEARLPYERLIVTTLYCDAFSTFATNGGAALEVSLFKCVTVERYATPRDVVSFMKVFKIAHCTMWEYVPGAERMHFHDKIDMIHVLWSGWYSKWRIRELVIDKLGPVLLTRGDFDNATAKLPDGSASQMQRITVKRCAVYGNVANLQFLLSYCRESIEHFAHEGADPTYHLSGVWPRLKTFSPYISVEFLREEATTLAPLFPNLHTVYPPTPPRLNCVQLEPKVRIFSEIYPEMCRHTALVRFRTHMAVRFYCGAFSKSHNRGVAMLMTKEYLNQFRYPKEAPEEFLYSEGTFPLEEPHFSHLKDFRDKVETKTPQHVKDQRSMHLEVLRRKLHQLQADYDATKKEYDAKVNGKRKRLHNALEKLETKLVDMREEEATIARLVNATDYQDSLIAIASQAYMKAYLEQIFVEQE